MLMVEISLEVSKIPFCYIRTTHHHHHHHSHHPHSHSHYHHCNHHQHHHCNHHQHHQLHPGGIQLGMLVGAAILMHGDHQMQVNQPTNTVQLGATIGQPLNLFRMVKHIRRAIVAENVRGFTVLIGVQPILMIKHHHNRGSYLPINPLYNLLIHNPLCNLLIHHPHHHPHHHLHHHQSHNNLIHSLILLSLQKIKTVYDGYVKSGML